MDRFKADCSNCAALCCLGLAFDKSDKFGIDKPSGVACPNLDKNARCKIHKNLSWHGFSGCEAYDCLGAGQLVSREVFNGKSWQSDPELRDPMMNAFRIMRQVQALKQLLETAKMLPMDRHEITTRDSFLDALNPENGWTESDLIVFETGNIAQQVADFLATFRDKAKGIT